MKITLLQGITTAGAVAAMIASIFAIDARYTKDSDLEHAKNQIITELRTEVTINRAMMLNNMQLDADDIEWEMTQLELQEKTVPRYLQEKFKHLTRQIKELKKDEKD